MMLPWLIVGAGVLWALASTGRKERQRQVLAALRRQFPPIARMRLVGACAELDDVLDDASLEPVFDWMYAEMLRRTDSRDFGALMRWATGHEQAQRDALTQAVARDAVERLPRAALKSIDGCHGREFAAATLDLALFEAGQRAGAQVRN